MQQRRRRGGEADACPHPNPSPGRRGARPLSFRPKGWDDGYLASLRPYLQLSKGGAAVPFGVVHVFGGGRRINVMAGGDGANDIGHGDERGLSIRAVECCDKSVVAIFGMRGLNVLAEPREGFDRA